MNVKAIILLCISAFVIFNGEAFSQDYCEKFECYQGAVIKGDTRLKKLSLVFTGHTFAEGGEHVLQVLNKQDIKGAFFFTGDFYRNPDFKELIQKLHRYGHYLGAHSDKHLLYCDWAKRDSLLVSKAVFQKDLKDNYAEMKRFGIDKTDAPFFLPPYEWYNQTISNWTNEMDLQLINFSSGTRSNADYTTPDMKNYLSSEQIFNSIIQYEKESQTGLNGFMLLIHIGTAQERTDKFYHQLEKLIDTLQAKNYQIVPLTELLILP